MLGIIFGTICTLLLLRVLFGRYHHYHGHYRRGRSWFLRRILYKLNTGPGQEKVVLGELSTLRETARELRSELTATREQIAAIVRDEQFDQNKVDALFRKQDELLGKLRTAAASSLERIHGVLDQRQRNDLAAMVQGHGFHYGYGC